MKTTLPKEFIALQTDLLRLSKERLPVKTRGAIDTVLQRLTHLDQYLHDYRSGDRLSALYAVSKSLGTSLNLDEVLNQVMDAVIQLTGAERGFLTLVDGDTGALEHYAARNFERESIPEKDVEISTTVVKSVIASGKGIVTTDAQSDPRFAKEESVIFYSLRSILCAPLQTQGETIGVIYVDHRAHSNRFTEDDLEIFNALANQAAVAIENAGRYTRIDKALNNRIEELETLTEIDMQLNENLDFQRIIELTIDWAIKGTHGAQAWVTIFEEGLTNQTQHYKDSCEQLPFPPDTLLSQLSENFYAQVLQENRNAPAYLVAPIQHAGKSIGTLTVAHPKSFSEQAIQFVGRLAARASVALENAHLYQAVQDANESKSQFISIVTHELRIPLTSIKGYTDLIYQGVVGPVTEQQKEFLRVIRNNSNRMAALISDLSDISRIERGILKLDPVFIPLHGYVDEIINRLRPNIEGKSQEVFITVPESLPRVYADPNRLVQILTNLVSNASKYTPENGSITIQASQDQGQVRVEVIDNGIGINPEDQAKLFTKFFRSESPAVREQNGWGLGLSVTKKLVEVMGGKIGMTSSPGKGSTFWFRIPTAQPTD
jgi:signal transduction histidine kinase